MCGAFCMSGKGISPVSIFEDLDAIKLKKLNLHEWLESREPAERKRFDEACRDRRIPTRALLSVVRKHGAATAESSLAEYRNSVAGR